jgi:hypothetical protein
MGLSGLLNFAIPSRKRRHSKQYARAGRWQKQGGPEAAPGRVRQIVVLSGL